MTRSMNRNPGLRRAGTASAAGDFRLVDKFCGVRAVRAVAGFAGHPDQSAANPNLRPVDSCGNSAARLQNKGFECRSESNQRQGRDGWGRGSCKTIDRRHGLRVGEPTRIGRLSWPALGRTSNVSERGVTAGETAPSFGSARTYSAIGSARGTSAMLHPGVADGPTASLAGRDSGDRAERRSTNSGSRAKCPAVARSVIGRAAR